MLESSKPAPEDHTKMNDWANLLAQLKLTGLAQVLAGNCSLESIDDTQVKLMLSASHEPMLNKKLVERIQQALSDHLQKPLKLLIEVSKEEVMAPEKQKQIENKIRQENAVESIQNDSKVKEIMRMFDAKLDLGSIKVTDK